MKVVALVGQSGTGKSHHAVLVARKEGVKAIIDDGLLIASNKVIAGHSAKRESTKIASVRRAIFTDTEHIKEVKEAIEQNNIDSILILGTSEDMTNRIAQKLGLGDVSKYIHIEEVSTPQDIAIARRLRDTQGKHIIPVPTFEIRKDFSGYFLHPLRLFRRKQGKKEEIADKSVVRPTYSYMGDYTISDNTIVQMVVYEAKKIEGVSKANAVIVNNSNGEVEVNINVSLNFGTNIKVACNDISSKVVKQIDKMTALCVCKVNVTVKELVM